MFQQYDNWPSDITDDELLVEPLAYFGHYDRNHIRVVLDPDIKLDRAERAPGLVIRESSL